MLMMIGPLRFQIAPFNATEVSHSHTSDFAEKPVVGTRPPLEFVGEGGETWNVRANLFPERFGGEANLSALQALRASGKPQYMMRGDGRLMGWVVISDVRERSTYLDRQGRGRVVEVDITLRRASKPSPTRFFSAIQSLAAGLF